ncbi:uncharacterized protein CTHT_0071850 [Thermochaetoides thermophila DSM 1495]|uniref:G domain-containing protein n=1 Tax=Chaetomium thermophilum (strain DSM 1495 / CBS 144.50 / IMI 039719) TaxID=759272 RepID=G0SFR6_CHATD|nr:hypothetical protein CTHT_0071850 [Thermochaetoides thermophila DSM 1495]EGS17831.1 hypothetical protein CTHT_0071850 [Thermochaetoides thermophila DSM 1495]
MAAVHLSPRPPLSPPLEFFADCPKFRLLVLGNPESTKQELFSKIFGVELSKKAVDDFFNQTHDIEQELELQGQNERLIIHTSLNLGAADESDYHRLCDFLRSRSTLTTPLQDRIHCIWYCVASEEDRSVLEIEARFLTKGLPSAAPNVPLVLVFTKYEEFVARVKIEWSRDAQEQGLSKVAVSHILRDLSSKKFEQAIGRKWNGVLEASVPRVKISSGDSEDDVRSFEELAESTLSTLQNRSVKFVYAAAQRNSAFISARFCAATAADYFEVDTGHARKMHGVDTLEILPNFLAKATQIFNMRDTNTPPALADTTDNTLLFRILDAAFPSSQKPLISEILNRSGTETGTILSSLSPHERGVLLGQALASIVLFLHRVADTQWPYNHDTAAAGAEAVAPLAGSATAHSHTVTAQVVDRTLQGIKTGPGKDEVLQAVEGSRVFTTCTHRKDIADLIVQAVEKGERAERGVQAKEHGHEGVGQMTHWLTFEDEGKKQEMSLSFVNDKSTDDVILPCGLTILPLT